MEDLILGLTIGIVVGGALSYLYAASVISKYKSAAAGVGVVFKEVEGKLAAIKKVL